MTRRSIGASGATVVVAILAACSQPTGGQLSPSAIPGLGTSASLSDGPAHIVTGTGEATNGSVAYRATISGRLSQTGKASGTLTVHVFDLTAYGVTGQPTFVSDIDCLAIDGNKAWFSTTVRSSSNPSAFPVGFRGLGAIEDLPDGDLIFSGPGSYEAFGLTCADKPAIALTFAVPALNGNFTVR